MMETSFAGICSFPPSLLFSSLRLIFAPHGTGLPFKAHSRHVRTLRFGNRVTVCRRSFHDSSEHSFRHLPL